MREVVLVSNAEGGTVDIIDVDSLTIVKTIDLIPDGESPSLQDDPVHAIGAPIATGLAGANYGQDLDLAPDGRTLYVSRGHRGDVAAFDLESGDLLWRLPVSGLRADHMALDPEGRLLFVSVLLDADNLVEVIDTQTQAVIGSFPTGEWPHDNVVSPDGTRVYNGSLGNIVAPDETRNNRPDALDVLGAPYQLTVADIETLEVVRRLEFPRGIRPFVITPDEKLMYVQLSEFHGVVEYDLDLGRIRRASELPIDEGVTSDDYDFEAPHHGLDLSEDGSVLCVAGRASDYVALVSTQTLRPLKIIDVDDAPGDAHNTHDGRYCVVASTRADTVSVISYATLEKVATIPVGDGPKHIEPAHVPASVLA